MIFWSKWQSLEKNKAEVDKAMLAKKLDLKPTSRVTKLTKKQINGLKAQK